MEHSQRHADIIEQLRREGRVEVVDLAQRFGTSEITIRRDLEHLAEASVLRRVRGGAISLLLRGEGPGFSLRAHEDASSKERIAVAVSALIRDGEAIALDSGTSGLAVARALAGKHLTVVPLSLQGAAALSEQPSIRLLLPGGEVRPGEQSFTGAIAERTIASLRFDTAIVTCCGFSPTHGVTAFDVQDAAIKRAAIDSANHVILAAGSSKFARTAMAVVCAAKDLDIVVTDRDVPTAMAAQLESLGVEVVRV